jgi:outer membrane protein assembly factor BamD
VTLPSPSGLRRTLLSRCAALLLAATTALLTLGPTEAEARRQLSVQEQFELGRRYSKRGYHVRALEEFNRIRNNYRDDPFAVKAELAIADVYFDQAEWDQARLSYEDFLRMHPRHPELDYVVWRIGLTSLKKAAKIAARDQSWTQEAITAWTGFDRRFPDSAHKAEVTEKLAECTERLAKKELLIARFYAKRKAWRAVEGRARGVLAAYPDSAHVVESMALLAVAYAHQGKADRSDEVLRRLAEADAEAHKRAAAQVERARARAEG